MSRKSGCLADEVSRFMARCVQDGPCLMSPMKGYGSVRFDRGLKMSAHRASYLVNIGPIPEHMVVRHTCDRIGCVAPEHLIVGTYADNARDASERRRLRSGLDHPAAHTPTSVVASAIREYRNGGKSQAEMARKVGVSQVTFGRWVRGEQRADAAQAPINVGKGSRELVGPRRWIGDPS